MSANDALFPTSSYFPPPDLASSGFGSSHAIDPIFFTQNNSNVSTAPASASGTSSYEIPSLPPCPSSSTTNTPFVNYSVPLNNATNNYLDTLSAQLLPGASFSSGLSSLAGVGQKRDNIPPSQSATVPSGSKRKSDNDENCSGPNPKKGRVLHITQEPSQTQITIPPQLQDPQVGPQLNLQIPNQQVQCGFEIPPEILSIKIELNDLISFPVIPSVEFPPCGPLLTTVVAREDVEKIERRFYPYLWFPGCAPYKLQQQDYNNILGRPHADAMKKALQRVGMNCGTLALTASHQLVLFFQGEEKKLALDAVVKSMGPNFCQTARWRGAMEIQGQNNSAVYLGQNIQQSAHGGSDSNASQSNAWNDHTEQHPQIDPTLPAPPSDSTTQQTLEATTVPPGPQATASQDHSSADSQAGLSSAVAESSTSSRKRNTSTRQPAQNRNTFVLVTGGKGWGS